MSRTARQLAQAISLEMSPGRRHELAGQLDAWYGAAGRHYHTLEHIKNSFAWLERAIRTGANAPVDAASLQIAILFHDAVYEPSRADNEQASSLYARAFLEQVQGHSEAVEPVSPERVDRLVLLTALHGDALKAAVLDTDEQLMLDIDLAILAAPDSDYRRYARGVALEYAPVATPGQYRAGRAAFLGSMLAQPAIYRTTLLGAGADGRARQNMEQELLFWEGSVSPGKF